MGKIGVTKIEITRAEGPMALCGKTATFQSFEDAHNWLVCQSSTFPKMGYDKHDFAVSFMEKYKRILARERYAKAAPRYLEILEKYDV